MYIIYLLDTTRRVPINTLISVHSETRQSPVHRVFFINAQSTASTTYGLSWADSRDPSLLIRYTANSQQITLAATTRTRLVKNTQTPYPVAYDSDLEQSKLSLMSLSWFLQWVSRSRSVPLGTTDNKMIWKTIILGINKLMENRITSTANTKLR